MGMEFLKPLVISPIFILLFSKGNKVGLDNNKVQDFMNKVTLPLPRKGDRPQTSLTLSGQPVMHVHVEKITTEA